MKLSRRLRLLTALVVLVGLVWTTGPAVGQDEEQLVSWPRQLDGERAQVIVYQPQLESYSGDRLEARAAVSVTMKGETEPVFGALWFEARVLTDLDTRMVSLESVEVTATQFPSATDEQIEELSGYLEAEIPKWEMVMSMDRLLAALDGVEGVAQEEGGLNHDPPELIVVTSPTVLVMIDGDPILDDLDYEGLKYVANSPFYILQEPGTGQYYLKGGDYWYVAPDLMADWVVAENLPGDVAAVAKEVAKQEQEAEPGQEATPEDDEGEQPAPKVVVRTRAAELIQINGEPELASVEGTDLLYIRNTESDVIMDIASQQYYVLVAGRWYESGALTGAPWTHVPPDAVPASFAQIPEESEVASVRSSVAGTQEAKEAVLETSIPQTAEVDRRTATVTVEYDGDPQFETCADNVAYAINTNKSVLLVGNTYYCCDEAIWFVSTGPTGPWEVATSVPDEILDIPADCPVHNVKYVYIYDSTPDVVYIGYMPGYVGSYVYHGCVVYGSGYWYQPWYGSYYYPRAVTWGYGVHWNPYTGWGFSVGVSFGWLHVSFGRPYYSSWWGPAGYHHGYRHGYHHGYHRGFNQGAYAGYRAGYKAGQRTSDGQNLYKSRDDGVRRTGSDRLASDRVASGRQASPLSRPGSPTSVRKPVQANRPNDVFADRDGNVYRKQGNDWQERDKSGWSAPKTQPSRNLDRDSSSRQRGSQRTKKAKSSRSSTPRSRPSGGGRRRG
ncbi:MAG: hypothetical protein V3T20_03780 [Gemmatimonadota bacterium]